MYLGNFLGPSTMSDLTLIIGQCDLYFILAIISFTVSLTYIIPQVMVHSNTSIDLISLLGHCVLYFTVECNCHTSGNS